ncbi:hypothetical protein SAMN05444722_3721 [Rhodovulum sp. ES.010]|uniref:hypothetical protein n=1 Tax=Rhodovulum sp. ES.010 TaxID=1882821 RepID=UPI000927689E|nr:hypothetical protein [Rhodovulum sp. ES.010]SIO57380.1 hypothetical protein SAMN05444722_3721 [Rhodovulum sp. ES.010]
MSETLAILSVSAPRRLFGLSVTLGLGALLLFIAGMRPPAEPFWRFFLALLGLAMLGLAEAMRRATAQSLRLTHEGLFDTAGRRLAGIGEIEGIDRGMFALKPSNGFTLRLARPAPRAWAPGVWWRLWRRLGVGGVTSAAQARAMAEVLSALLAERAESDGGGDDS